MYLTDDEIKKLRQENPDSVFLDEVYDKAILGITKFGNVKYHHYELLYSILDNEENLVNFEGEDYERSKSENDDYFFEYYELIDEQLLMEFDGYVTQFKYGGSKFIPPILIEVDEKGEIVEPQFDENGEIIDPEEY